MKNPRIFRTEEDVAIVLVDYYNGLTAKETSIKYDVPLATIHTWINTVGMKKRKRLDWNHIKNLITVHT